MLSTIGSSLYAMYQPLNIPTDPTPLQNENMTQKIRTTSSMWPFLKINENPSLLVNESISHAIYIYIYQYILVVCMHRWKYTNVTPKGDPFALKNLFLTLESSLPRKGWYQKHSKAAYKVALEELGHIPEWSVSFQWNDSNQQWPTTIKLRVAWDDTASSSWFNSNVLRATETCSFLQSQTLRYKHMSVSTVYVPASLHLHLSTPYLRHSFMPWTNHVCTC